MTDRLALALDLLTAINRLAVRAGRAGRADAEQARRLAGRLVVGSMTAPDADDPIGSVERFARAAGLAGLGRDELTAAIERALQTGPNAGDQAGPSWWWKQGNMA